MVVGVVLQVFMVMSPLRPVQIEGNVRRCQGGREDQVPNHHLQLNVTWICVFLLGGFLAHRLIPMDWLSH